MFLSGCIACFVHVCVSVCVCEYTSMNLPHVNTADRGRSEAGHGRDRAHPDCPHSLP